MKCRFLHLSKRQLHIFKPENAAALFQLGRGSKMQRATKGDKGQ